jgi:signal transduction histidine kinase
VIRCGAEPIDVAWDRLKIKQVLKNIIINSIEAFGEKPGEVVLSIFQDADRVRIEVSDNGAGLDSEELDLIFNEDYSTKEIGTGLGLFIVKRIVDLHQGRVDIQSEKNQGTTVSLEIPRHVRQT